MEFISVPLMLRNSNLIYSDTVVIQKQHNMDINRSSRKLGPVKCSSKSPLNKINKEK